jgi:hypothetical protein
MKYILVLLVSVTFLASIVSAQESPSPSASPVCSEVDQAALNTCIAACTAQVPQCQKPVISLDELRAKIAEKCQCDKVRNFGKYRSCVNSVVNPMRSFALLDETAKAAIAQDNAACKQAIQDRKKNNGKGPKK